MRMGFQRLQALIRSRKLTNQFKHLRRHIVSLQAICRGYLVRKEHRRRHRAAIKIQAAIRGMIARCRYVKLREEYRIKMDALRIKEQEEAQFRKQMNPKKAKEIAEMHFIERMKEMEDKVKEEERADQIIIQEKKAVIVDAINKHDEALDDSKLVDEMFNFLPPD